MTLSHISPGGEGSYSLARDLSFETMWNVFPVLVVGSVEIKEVVITYVTAYKIFQCIYSHNVSYMYN